MNHVKRKSKSNWSLEFRRLIGREGLSPARNAKREMTVSFIRTVLKNVEQEIRRGYLRRFYNSLLSRPPQVVSFSRQAPSTANQDDSGSNPKRSNLWGNCVFSSNMISRAYHVHLRSLPTLLPSHTLLLRRRLN